MHPLPRTAFLNDPRHPNHSHAVVHALHHNLLLIIADCNILLFDTVAQCYHHISTIPEYQHHTKSPPTIRSTDVSSYFGDDKYHFIFLQSHSHSATMTTTMTMHKLSIHIGTGDENIASDPFECDCQWIDIKPQFMDSRKSIDLQCSVLLRDDHREQFIFLFFIEIWPTRKCAVFDLEHHTMRTTVIDDNKWFSISSMLSVPSHQFLSFNNIGPEFIRCDLSGSSECVVQQKQIEFPVEFSLYFSSSNVRFSNYIIRFGSYSDCASSGIISIYDFINDQWYRSEVKRYGMRSVESAVIQNGYIHCFGRRQRKGNDRRFDRSMLDHYKINVELVLFGLELLYWDTSETSRILYVVDRWLTERRVSDRKWHRDLSLLIMSYLCVKA